MYISTRKKPKKQFIMSNISNIFSYFCIKKHKLIAPPPAWKAAPRVTGGTALGRHTTINHGTPKPNISHRMAHKT